MAARASITIRLALSLALALWIWGLVVVLFIVRWNSIERPPPPVRDIFPYGEMRVGVDASYPPFAVATADDLYGFEIDLAREIGRRLNVPVRFVNMGFDGMYDSLKVDQVDVLISAVLIDPSRMNDVRYSVPYYNDGLALVTSASSPIRSMDRLSGYSVAVEFGSQADLLARGWLRRISPFAIHPYEIPQYALESVRLGQSDAALVDATSVRLYLREHPEWSAQYQLACDVLYAAAVRIDRWERWDVINRSLQSMIEDGTLETLMRRWL